MKKSVFFLILLMLLIIAPMEYNVIKESKCAQKSLPVLAVVKKVDKKFVRIGEDFKVIIEISNVGNETAYNISIIEKFPGWGIEVVDVGAKFWPKLDPNETVYTIFVLRIKNFASSIANLGNTKVEYYDSNGNKYVTYSNQVTIGLIFYGGEELNVKKVWREVSIYIAVVFIVMASALSFLEYDFYRRYKREIERT